MKNTITLLLFAIIVMATTSCGPTKEDAITYNDKIIIEQVTIIEKIDKLYNALKNYKDQYGMDYALGYPGKKAGNGRNNKPSIYNYSSIADRKQDKFLYRNLEQIPFKSRTGCVTNL